MVLRVFIKDVGTYQMSNWKDTENEIIANNAGTLTSKQIAELLEGRTAKAVRHQAEKLEISLTGYKTNQKEAVELAMELRAVGFYREEVFKETGVSPSAQLYYENKSHA